LLRRKYIPPFYDSFCDMSFLYTERFDDKEMSSISNSTIVMLENIVDSVFSNENMCNPKDMECILEAKIDSLSLDNNSLFYVHNILNITSRDSYRLGLQYVFKVVLILEDYAKELLYPIKLTLCRKIEKEMKRSGIKDFSIKYNTSFI